MDDEVLLKYIQFSIIPGFGAVSQNRLLKICGSLESCFTLPSEQLLQRCRTAEKHLRLTENRIHSFLELRDSADIKEKAKKIVSLCHIKDVEVIPLPDDRYPWRFKNLPDMPIVLYVLGKLRINQYANSMGIIGARRCSAEGKQRAILCSEEAAIENYAIISGMAKGIDSYAHTAAVKKGSYTIAVLGCGPDICYPSEHRKLYDEIVSRGCILSEYPPGTKPRSYLFPERNRLIAALSDKVLVIDAGAHSGTRTTIENCHKYGREIVRVTSPQLFI